MSALNQIQAEVVQRLRASVALTALVPAAAISDGFAVPQIFPCITLGEDQQVGSGGWVNAPEVAISEVFATLHVWTRSSGFVLSKDIVAAVSSALRGQFPITGQPGLTCFYEGARFLRDIDGISQHAVITLRFAPLREVA